ncbi:nuclear transport factor 2 family protein [Roseibium sp. HPY-6]|uniref:nuclear transport factor 2 family protein n=1 Tax=Roseibium sp. HPY-6 TaxID=3229852 RepID=UPI00338F92C6
MLDEKWGIYAKTWSQPDEARDATLATLVSEDVTYTDPTAEVVGRAAFSAHISNFQKDVPGGFFEIVDVKSHHNHTLARWTLRGKNGAEMMQGTSHATLNSDGEFTSFTGFF